MHSTPMYTLQHTFVVQQVSRFLEVWLTGTDPVQYTPTGLAWSSEWGTLRYTMNAALIAEIWSQAIAGKSLSMLAMHTRHLS